MPAPCARYCSIVTGHGLLDCGVGDGGLSADSGRRVVGTLHVLCHVHVGLRQRHRLTSLTGSADKGVFTRVTAAHCSHECWEGGGVVGEILGFWNSPSRGRSRTTEVVSSTRLRHHGHGRF